MVVGSVLALLLLLASWSLPEPPESFADRPEIIGRATIRIRSARTWPEKVVLDTSQPTIPPPSIEVVPAQQLVERLPDGMTDQTNAESLVKPKPDSRRIDARQPPARAKRKTVRAVPSSHVARFRSPNELQRLETGEECCWFERTDRRATSKAASRKRVGRRDSWIGWHFPETN